MEELDSSGQSGIVTFAPKGAQTEVVIEISAGEADVPQPVHIHAGSCDNLGGVDFPLSSIVNGKSVTVLDVSLPTLRQGLNTVNAHKSGAEIGTYVACGNIPAAGTTVTIPLAELNGSSQSGVATLAADGEQTVVALSVTAGAAGVPQPVHIHNGSCNNLGGVNTSLTSVVDGRSVSRIDATLDSLLAGGLAINLHRSGPEIGFYTACGNIPAVTVKAAPTGLDKPVVLAMGELNDSGQTGIVTLTPKGTKTGVTVSISAGGAGVPQPAHIHAGSCDDLGGVNYPLTSLVDGGSVTDVPASLPALLAGTMAVNVHRSGPEVGTYVSCGNLPKLSSVMSFAMGALNDSVQQGTVTLTGSGDQTIVAVDVVAGTAGVAQPVHIHEGSCDNLGGVAQALASVVDGTSVTVVDLKLEDLAGSDRAINLHKSGAEIGVYTSCADLGAASGDDSMASAGTGSGGAVPAPLASSIANFTLENLSIPVGTKVTWTNLDNAGHTVTHGESPVAASPAEFRSGTLRNGDSFTFTFNKTGTFRYFCEIHPQTMIATITVTG